MIFLSKKNVFLGKKNIFLGKKKGVYTLYVN